MKQTIQIGQSAEVEITVTNEMTAKFNGETVHELFSTSSLVHHMEWAARKAILSCLEAHEEAMGSMVEVHHLMPTLVGMQVKIVATISDIRERKVECQIEAFNSRGKIGRGVVIQSVIDKRWLTNKIAEISVVEHIKSSHQNQLR